MSSCLVNHDILFNKYTEVSNLCSIKLETLQSTFFWPLNKQLLLPNVSLALKCNMVVSQSDPVENCESEEEIKISSETVSSENML